MLLLDLLSFVAVIVVVVDLAILFTGFVRISVIRIALCHGVSSQFRGVTHGDKLLPLRHSVRPSINSHAEASRSVTGCGLLRETEGPPVDGALV
jgi:hypothetical protein